MLRSFERFGTSVIEHFYSDVPIKCDLELQKEVTISPELFEPSDKDQGRDRTEPGLQN